MRVVNKVTRALIAAINAAQTATITDILRIRKTVSNI